MTASNDDASNNWRTPLSAAALVIGLALLALSLVWPSSSSAAATGWSAQQAKQYQQASARLHELSHTPPNATPAQRVAHDRALKQAEGEFHSMRADLDAALARPARWTSILRFAAACLIICGCYGLYRRSNGSNSAAA